MAMFTLTARQNISIGGQYIQKGQEVKINICQFGVNQSNLFHPARIDTIRRQFSAQGIDLPKNSPLLRVNWDIKMK